MYPTYWAGYNSKGNDYEGHLHPHPEGTFTRQPDGVVGYFCVATTDNGKCTGPRPEVKEYYKERAEQDGWVRSLKRSVSNLEEELEKQDAGTGYSDPYYLAVSACQKAYFLSLKLAKEGQRDPLGPWPTEQLTTPEDVERTLALRLANVDEETAQRLGLDSQE